MQSLKIEVCKDAEDAVKRGYVYGDGFIGVCLTTVVVVMDGTDCGNSTVDLIFEDDNGNKYVTMITGNLLKAIPC